MNRNRRCMTVLALAWMALPVWGQEASRLADLTRSGDAFTFCICADPQVGHRDNDGRVPKNARETLTQSTQAFNVMDPQPAFVIYLGDLCNVFDPASVENFEQCIAGLEPIPILVHGNHDGHVPYDDFRALQRRLNGLDQVFYSFNAGRWHFVVLPCNLAHRQPAEIEMEADMLAWLDADLEANKDRPTMVFEHLHLMPQGLTQTEWYTFPLALRQKLLDLITRHGNVKYYFNGHVHNGIKTSIKTSWTYKGTHFITAPTIIESRPFGADEEFDGFQQGLQTGGYYLVVHVEDDRAHVVGRLVGSDREYSYPEAFREFADEVEPRWLQREPEILAGPVLSNGSFESGLRGWLRPYRYQSDTEPGFVAETRPAPGGGAGAAGYVFVREKGQEWANDEMMELYQMVAAPPDGDPVLSVRYYLEERFQSGGGYVRINAVRDTESLFTMMFHWGENEALAHYLPRAIGYALHGEQQSWAFLQDLGADKRGLYWRVADTTETWHTVTADICALYDAALGDPGAFDRLGATKFFVGLGAWCNKDAGARSGVYFDDVRIEGRSAPGISLNDDSLLEVGPEVFRILFGQDLIEKEARKSNKRH